MHGSVTSESSHKGHCLRTARQRATVQALVEPESKVRDHRVLGSVTLRQRDLAQSLVGPEGEGY